MRGIIELLFEGNPENEADLGYGGLRHVLRDILKLGSVYSAVLVLGFDL